jgi:hypothetical protein
VAECCRNCKLRMELTKYDYSQGGCIHSDYDGWACMICAHEGTIIHMVGLDPDRAHCEMFTERNEL